MFSQMCMTTFEWRQNNDLGASVKVRKATISFVMFHCPSVCLSARNNSAPTGSIILIVEKRETNLMSLALLFYYLMLNMFRMLIHPSSAACDLFFELFHGLYCSGSMCVGVTLWFGWGGVVSVCRLKH